MKFAVYFHSNKKCFCDFIFFSVFIGLFIISNSSYAENVTKNIQPDNGNASSTKAVQIVKPKVSSNKKNQRLPFQLSVSRIDTGSSQISQTPSALQRHSWLTSFSFKMPLSLKHKIFAGVSLGYDQIDYDWKLPQVPLAPAPYSGGWSDIKRYSASFSVIYKPDEQWLVIFSPKVQKAYADGASSSNAVSYGGVLTAMYQFTSGNMLGGGVAYLNDLDDVRVIPFAAVRWQINDKWSLTNPFKAGFAGPAGLEVRNQFAQDWTLGFGGSRRTERFLLNNDKQNVEIEEWVSFVRLGWDLAPQLTINTYAGFFFAGQLSISNPNVSYDMENQGAAALSLDYRF